MTQDEFPEQGEFVVGTVDKIEDFGAYIELLEYDNVNGLCHQSEIASGWVKNSRDHANEGQRVVVKVIDVEDDSGNISLSLKDVNDEQEEHKIQEWKNRRKAENWLEIALRDYTEEEINSIRRRLKSNFDSLYHGFEESANNGKDALSNVDLSAEQLNDIVKTALENVSVPHVTVTGYVDLKSHRPDGIDVIKEVLKVTEEKDTPRNTEVSLGYIGAPEYRIEVQAPDYKTAESVLESTHQRAVEEIEERGGTGNFHRERHEDDN